MDLMKILSHILSLKGSAIDIDDEQDWQFAEKLFKLIKNEKRGI